MAEAGEKVCPECKGMKVIPGSCECNMEWRGNKGDNDVWEDCRCARELECPACHGAGLIEQ